MSSQWPNGSARSQRRRVRSARGKRDTHFGFDLGAGFAAAFDFDDALQFGPFVALGQPFDALEGRDRAGFYAAMVAIDRGGAIDLRILEAAGALFGVEHPDAFMTGRLIAFHRQNIVCAPVDDLLGDFALTSHGRHPELVEGRWSRSPRRWRARSKASG